MNLFILAFAPVAIILVYVYFRDKYEKEPFSLLLKTLAAGAFITIPVIFTETALEKYIIYFTGYEAIAYRAFFVAGFTEEFYKFIFLFYLIWRSKEFDERIDGIVYAVFISLGFALVENIIYVYKFGTVTGYARALTAVPAHALFGVTMGYYFSLARFMRKRKLANLLSALFIPVVLHGFYDFILMLKNDYYFLVFIPFVYYLWRSGFRKLHELSNN